MKFLFTGSMQRCRIHRNCQAGRCCNSHNYTSWRGGGDHVDCNSDAYVDCYPRRDNVCKRENFERRKWWWRSGFGWWVSSKNEDKSPNVLRQKFLIETWTSKKQFLIEGTEEFTLNAWEIYQLFVFGFFYVGFTFFVLTVWSFDVPWFLIFSDSQSKFEEMKEFLYD